MRDAGSGMRHPRSPDVSEDARRIRPRELWDSRISHPASRIPAGPHRAAALHGAARAGAGFRGHARPRRDDGVPRGRARGLLRHGLAAPAAHVSLAPNEWRAALDAAPVIGHRYLVVPWIAAEARRTLDDYKRMAQRFNQAATAARAAGIQFAYHNHDFEFVPMDGRLPYDVLLAETDPHLVQLEIDLYWITKGGQDPLTYFARWPGRVPLVHVKDSAGPPDHRMVDVGAGTIDWKRIFAQGEQAGIRHCFVEHDAPANAFASIRASYEYLKRLEF